MHRRRWGRSFNKRFVSVDVQRQDPNDSRQVTDVATAVSMIIIPRSTFEDPSQFQTQTPKPRYNAVLRSKNENIKHDDIIISQDYGVLVVVQVLADANTDNMELELEQHG